MLHCAVVSDVTTNPLPPPHPELLKYLYAPKKVLKRARSSIDKCKNEFKVKEVPKSMSKGGAAKREHELATMEDDEMLLLDRKPESLKTNTGLVPVMKDELKPECVPPTDRKGKVQVANQDDSETEDDGEDYITVQAPVDRKFSDLSLNSEKFPARSEPSSRHGSPLPTSARSVSPYIEHSRAPGRIIGTMHPLKDFEKYLSQGGLVTKVVSDLFEVIIEILIKPFASRRHKEMTECMKTLRDICLKVSLDNHCQGSPNESCQPRRRMKLTHGTRKPFQVLH